MKRKRKMKINTKLTCWRKCFRKYPSNDKKKKKKKKKKIRKGKKRKEKKKKLPDLFSGILQGFFFPQEVRVKSPSLRFYFRRPFRQ